MLTPKPFPASGWFSVLSAALPASRGEVPRTSVSALVDTRMDRGILAGADDVLGRSASSCRSTRCGRGGSGGAFDLLGAGRLVDTMRGGIGTNVAGLNMAVTALSLIGGLSQHQANTAIAMSKLLAMYKANPADLRPLSVARALNARATQATNMFAASLDAAFRGSLPGQLLHIGPALAGSIGSYASGLQDRASGALAKLRAKRVSDPLVADLEELGLDDVPVPPELDMDEIQDLFPGEPTGYFDDVGIAESIDALNEDVVDGVEEAIAPAIAEAEGSQDDLDPTSDPAFEDASVTVKRLQGVRLIDGPKDADYISEGTVLSDEAEFRVEATVAKTPQGKAGLKSKLGLLAKILALLGRRKGFSGTASLALMLRDAERMRLLGSGGDIGLALGLASLIGSSKNVLSGSCAFNSSMGSALGCMGGGMDQNSELALIEQILDALLCMAASSGKGSASSRKAALDALRQALLMGALMALLGGLPDPCRSSTSPIGGCY